MIFSASSIFGWANRNQGSNYIVHTEKKTETFISKEICHLIKTAIEKEPLIKIFHFVGTDKSITTCLEKEIEGMS